jgi:hypothetical protein
VKIQGADGAIVADTSPGGASGSGKKKGGRGGKGKKVAE